MTKVNKKSVCIKSIDFTKTLNYFINDALLIAETKTLTDTHKISIVLQKNTIRFNQMNSEELLAYRTNEFA